MTRERDAPQPATTRVRSARSAWVVALAVVVVLGSVIFIGISGQQAKPDSAPTAPPVAAAATPAAAAPSATPRPPATDVTDVTQPMPGAYPGPTEFVPDGPRHPSATLGVALTLGGRLTLAQLDEYAPRHFQASYLAPLPVPRSDGFLQLLNVAYWPPADNPYGTWRLASDSLDLLDETAVLLDVTAGPKPDVVSSAPQLTHNGFHVAVSAHRQANFALLQVTVTVGRDPVYPNESYDVVALADGRAISPEITSDRPGHLLGTLNFGRRSIGKTISFVIKAIPANNRFPGVVVVDTYDVTVPGKRVESQTLATRDPDPRAAGLVGIIANGYAWQSKVEWSDGRVILTFELTVNPVWDPELFPLPMSGSSA